MKQLTNILIFALMALASCSISEHRANTTDDDCNSIYYWKTEFKISNWDREFMDRHNIKRIYLRVFDVDVDYNSGKPVPIATTVFAGEAPKGIEIVPVVYITTSAINHENICQYDTSMYKRIRAMAKRHGFSDMKELQLDCDWTSLSQKPYFALCHSISAMAKADGIATSSTIRLHQLKSEAPPVDRGVLMLYNTGSIYDPDTENSILNADDVMPYLKSGITYPIPLSFAYPTFGWSILLRDNEFAALLHETDFSDTSLYQPLPDHRFKIVKEHYIENKRLSEGDIVRVEYSDINEIIKAQKLVESAFNEHGGTLIFHLDSLNISRYTNEQINSIYTGK